MTARDALLVPAGFGDCEVARAMGTARRTAKLVRFWPDAWAGRMVQIPLHDAVITAECYLGADPDRAMAAHNEIRFLLGDYLTAPRGRLA